MSKFLPNTFTLKTDQLRRISAVDACKCIQPLIDGRGKIHYNSGAMGPPWRQWLELRVMFPKGLYTYAFGIVEERIADLWVLITPSCSVYSIDHPESGNAKTIITIPQLQALNRLIEVGPCKASGILRTSTGPTEDRPKKASKPTKKVLAAERAK
jgi:hypothetical protein